MRGREHAMTSRFGASGLPLAASVVAVLIAVAIISAERLHHEAATLLLLVGFALGVALLTRRLVEPMPALPSLFCLFYFVFFYALPGMVQLSSNTFFWSRIAYDEQATLRAAAILPLFLLGFALGQRLAGPDRYRQAWATVVASERHPRVVLIGLFCAAAVALAHQSYQRFGETLLLSTRRAFSEQVLSLISQLEIGIWLQLPRAMTFCAVLIAMHAIVTWRRQGRAIWAAVGVPLLLLVLPAFAITNNPLAMPRNWQFAMIIALLVVFVPRWPPWLRVSLTAAMLLATFSLFQWLNILRGGGPGASTFQLLSPIDYLRHGDFDGVQTTINAVLYADANGHSWGRMLLSCLLFFVPRSLWPDKAESSGQVTARALGYDFTNLSMPLPAELYLEFSYAGVIVGGVVVGWAFRRLDYLGAAAIDRGGIGLYRVLIAVICGFTIFAMRGALYAVSPVVLPVIALITLLIKIPDILDGISGGAGSRPRRLRPAQAAAGADSGVTSTAT
jgi:hypothetical protein